MANDPFYLKNVQYVIHSMSNCLWDTGKLFLPHCKLSRHLSITLFCITFCPIQPWKSEQRFTPGFGKSPLVQIQILIIL